MLIKNILLSIMMLVLVLLIVKYIENTDTKILISEITEISNAIKLYEEDTGKRLPLEDYSFKLTKSSRLAEDYEVEGWSGPYLHYPVYGIIHRNMIHPEYQSIEIEKADKEKNYCDNLDNACYYWVSLEDVPKDLALSLNNHLDGKEGVFGYRSNKVHYYATNKNDSVKLSYRALKYKN